MKQLSRLIALIAVTLAIQAHAQNGTKNYLGTVITIPDASAPGTNSANPLYTTGGTGTTTPTTVTYGNGAGTIANGGTAQTALAAGSIVHGFDLANPSTATEPLYFSLNGPATATTATPSLSPGYGYHGSYGTAQALSVIAATTGHAFIALPY